MKMSAAEQLRTSWKAKGTPPCDHPNIEQEREDSRGAGTGDYVCTTCGAFVDRPRDGYLGKDVSEVLVCYALWVYESLSTLHPHRVTS